MNNYNFNHLFHFYITAKMDGVTVAAKYLNTSQSSLSIQIKTLEATLGVKLFTKAGRRMVLSDSGKEVFGYCRRAFESFDEMYDQVNKKSSAMGIRISFGVANDIERPFVADLFAKVYRKFPAGKRPLLNLVSLPNDQLNSLLELGEVDFLLSGQLIVGHDTEIYSESFLPVHAFLNRELSAKAKAKGLTFDEIIKKSEFNFVLASKRLSLRAEIDAYFLKKKSNPVVVFESNVLSTVVRSAIDGLGVTILPSAYVQRETKSEQLIKISEKALWNHRLFFYGMKNRTDERRREFIALVNGQLQLLLEPDYASSTSRLKRG